MLAGVFPRRLAVPRGFLFSGHVDVIVGDMPRHLFQRRVERRLRAGITGFHGGLIRALAVRALHTGGALRAFRANVALGTLYALDTLRTLGTRRALGTRLTLGTGGALDALLALWANVTLVALFALGALDALCTGGALRAFRALQLANAYPV